MNPGANKKLQGAKIENVRSNTIEMMKKKVATIAVSESDSGKLFGSGTNVAPPRSIAVKKFDQRYRKKRSQSMLHDTMEST